jgi:VanZ family protein
MNRLLLWLCVALWLGVLIWAITVSYFSSLTGPEIESMLSIPIWDKLSHFAVFAVGGILTAAALRNSVHWSMPTIVIVSAVSLSVFGAIDEWHQQYTPLRFGADRYDWLADTVGAMTGSLIYSLIYARRNSSPAETAPAGD